MTFMSFVLAYMDGSIRSNVGWRAYDIEAMVKPDYVLKALKYLGYARMKDHALSTVAKVYEIETADEARKLLELWWAFEHINGERVRRPPLRKD